MRQVELVIQVENDDDADDAFTVLEHLVEKNREMLASTGASDIFVTDDRGTVSRP